MMKKITTIEELGEVLQAHVSHSEKRHHEIQENFKSLGGHLTSIEDRLEQLAEVQRLAIRVERIAQHLRERDRAEL
jgi:hypothetical protein